MRGGEVAEYHKHYEDEKQYTSVKIWYMNITSTHRIRLPYKSSKEIQWLDLNVSKYIQSLRCFSFPFLYVPNRQFHLLTIEWISQFVAAFADIFWWRLVGFMKTYPKLLQFREKGKSFLNIGLFMKYLQVFGQNYSKHFKRITLHFLQLLGIKIESVDSCMHSQTDKFSLKGFE